MKTIVGEYVSEVPTQSEAVDALRSSVAQLPAGRWLLAVSGGRDSMVLLDAFAATRPADVAGVATYDHGTGTAATKAAALVERRALELGLPSITGKALAGTGPDEASLRAARWRFLRGWSDELQAKVVTAHTWDDQVETVVLRLLRDSGARGLAGMLARPFVDASARRPGWLDIARPFVTQRREAVVQYARAEAVPFVEDPSNVSMMYARNRVRHEILPALERAAPGFAAWCWDLSTRAAALRAGVAQWVDDVLAPTYSSDRAVGVAAAPLLGLSPEEASTVWPEIASRAGIAMDRRGIARTVEWAPTAAESSRIQLAGGGEVLRTRSAFLVRPVY